MSNGVVIIPGPRQALVAHRRSVVLLALVSLLAAPEVASAATVSVEDGRLAFTAGGGAVAMTCSSACTMSARLVVSRAASRRLGLELRAAPAGRGERDP